MKRQYDESGYCLFRGAMPPDEISALHDTAYDLVTPYRGKILRQNISPRSPIVTGVPTKGATPRWSPTRS